MATEYLPSIVMLMWPVELEAPHPAASIVVQRIRGDAAALDPSRLRHHIEILMCAIDAGNVSHVLS